MADIDQELLSEAVKETETEILNEAFQDAPAEPEQTEAEVEAPENRDPDTGRFTAKTEQTTEPEPKAEAPKAEDQDERGQVPSWRVREINEERRAAIARAEAAERERSEFKARLDALERQNQQQPKQEPKQERPDPILDPDGYEKWIESRFEAKRSEDRLNFSMGLAHARHGDVFEKAYAALLAEGQRGNRQVVSQITSQPNPGEAVVTWYRNQEVLREVGTDPAAYKNKVLEDALNDQAFIAKVIEKVKGGSGQQRPNNITQLPPSLSRATGSKSGQSIEDDTDGSDEAVFKYAFR